MIAIRDIKMPKECYRCPLLDGEYGTCNIIGETKVDMTKERASNCPLVEIQEQKTGHWIDEDEKTAVCSCCNRNNLLYGDFCKWCGTKMKSEA